MIYIIHIDASFIFGCIGCIDTDKFIFGCIECIDTDKFIFCCIGYIDTDKFIYGCKGCINTDKFIFDWILLELINFTNHKNYIFSFSLQIQIEKEQLTVTKYFRKRQKIFFSPTVFVEELNICLFQVFCSLITTQNKKPVKMKFS